MFSGVSLFLVLLLVFFLALNLLLHWSIRTSTLNGGSSAIPKGKAEAAVPWNDCVHVTLLTPRWRPAAL